MLLNSNRMSKIEIIEKVLFGRSLISSTSDNGKVGILSNLVDSLDKDWFNYMPSTFFIDKYKEEIEEFKDALKSYYQNYEYLESNNLLESAKYNVIAELSDVILATSSALFEHKVEESIVVSSMRDIINYSVELADRFGREVFIANVSVVDIIDAHISKAKEMVDAKDIYRACIYRDMSEHSKWFSMLLKLYTLEEILDPSNKMKIVKEIRRMLFALNNLGTNG